MDYRLYSDDCLYFSNSTSHSSSDMGGRPPVNFQSVIERPDRVTPPRTTILKTQVADAKSQIPTAFRALGAAVTKNFTPPVFFEEINAELDKFLNESLQKFYGKKKEIYLSISSICIRKQMH